MAGLDWARTQPHTADEPTVLDRLSKVDWEFVFTLVLCLGAATAVSTALEDGGWSKDMPPLTVLVVTGLISAALLARTRVSMFVAWPLGIVLGAAVVFWQTLRLAGPGTIDERVSSIYTRFDAWFHVAFNDGVTNDQLPFNVLVLSLTWLGVFLFGWSVVRWHNAWIGLVPGGAVIFLDLVLVGDDLTGTIVLYMLLGFLLVMQTNLNANLKRWRAEGVEFPAFLNVSLLHFSLWALIGVMALAWLVPAGPYSTPAPVQGVINSTLERGADVVRLAGPLRSNRIIPIHSYTGTLTFDGSVNLGDRELMAVTITDPSIRGGMLLRGSVYDEYQSGGWQTGDRLEVNVPDGTTDGVASELRNTPDEEQDGLIVPLHIEMLAKSVVGTVMFSPGTAVDFDRTLTIDVPEDAVSSREPHPLAGPGHSDADVATLTLDEGQILVRVLRDQGNNQPLRVDYIDAEVAALGETVEIDPGERIKRYREYTVTGFIPDITADDLRASDSGETPGWIASTYTDLPDSVTDRVHNQAAALAAGAATRYDKTEAIQTYLRQFPVDYDIGSTPPGQDTVDYFLFDSRRGYFDYHASAMVVMLRSVDVPARLAVGFAIDEADYSAAERSYIVQDNNSYAWAEVYFPEYGWVQFNPSPDRPAIIEPVEIDPLSSLDDPLGLDPALRDQLPIGATDGFYIPPELESAPTVSGNGSVSAVDTDQSQFNQWLLLGLVGFGSAVAVAATIGWNRSVSGLPYPQQIWEKTVRLASWGGMAPQPGQTPHEFVASLSRRHRGVRDLDVLASAYAGSRFGKKELGEADRERLSRMWPALRSALLGGIVGRVTRRGKTPD